MSTRKESFRRRVLGGWLRALTCVPLATFVVTAQAQGPRVRFVSPEADSLASGLITLKVQIEPADQDANVSDLTFSVDGRTVCQLTTERECVWDAGPNVKRHVIRAVARLANGSRVINSIRTKDLDYVERVDVDAVQLPVVVTDSEGRFVRGLPRAAFRVIEDDVPQRITSFESENVPLELVAALDVSQSMTEAMPQVRAAARAFLSAIEATDQVSVIAFNDNIFTLTRRATTEEGRLRAVERLAPWGGTALYDAIIKGVDLLGRQVGRRALVVFTDGRDESSHATLEAARTRVETTDAAVYAVGLGHAIDTPEQRELLDRFARVSGGRGLFKERVEDLEEAFDEILQDLSNQYLVGFQPTNQDRDGKFRRLRVEVEGNYRVRHREGYRLAS